MRNEWSADASEVTGGQIDAVIEREIFFTDIELENEFDYL